MRARHGSITHEVFNQSPPFEDVDLFAVDRPLAAAVAANGGAAAEKDLSEFGRHWGSAAMAARGRIANENTPKLRTFDARGNRRDEIEFHPAYHELMAHSAHAGLHNSTWEPNGKPAGAPSEVVRAAKFYIATQVETGHLCPITMTRASVAALAAQPDLLAKVMPAVATRSYDPTFAPWWTKRGMTLGMGMTEKQGGTDVRANMTRATGEGGAYRITGHKWFMSAPMCDAFLVLAQAGEGLSCFFMPRFAPDGSVNAIHFQRLKDKLGNRSNASSEVEFNNSYAERVGDEGKGIRTIIQMVQLTRQDCAIASAGLMRSGLAHALHHARHRSVFQKHLADQPLMQMVLSDMALHVEASIALVMRLCRAFDEAPHDAKAAAYMRLLTPAIKYWVCKSAPGFLYEAMECLGGNGYVEEGILARHYRESPVNAIWEGSGNVMCLDVLRALSREADAAMGVLRSLIDETRGLPVRRRGLPSSATRSAGPTASALPGWPWRSLRCWLPQPPSTACRRAVPNCSRQRGWPRITLACTAPSILPTTISAACWSGHCLGKQVAMPGLGTSPGMAAKKGRLMSLLESPASRAAPAPLPGAPVQPRIWKFWGTSLWGLLLFAAMFAGQFLLVVAFFLAKGPPFDIASIKAVASAGTVISLSVMMGLPAVLAVLWLATRMARMPFADYLALRRTSWRDLLTGIVALIVLIAGWDLLSRMLGREISPGFMVDVLKSAQADGALWLLLLAFAVAAPITEELMVRGFLYRGWSESALGPAGAIVLSSLAWTAMHAQYYDWFLFSEVLSIGLLLGYMRYRSNSTWLTIIMHGINNLAATLQSIWLAGHS